MNINNQHITCTPISKPKLNNRNLNFGSLHSSINKISHIANENIAKGMGKILNNNTVIKIAEKYHQTNIADYAFKATGVLLSSFFIYQTLKSDKIEEKRKKPLALNAGISCAIATIGGITVDKLLDKSFNRFVKAFENANKNVKNVGKMADGMKELKGALLFGSIYRFIVPLAATIVAEKIVNSKKKKDQALNVKA